VAHGFAGGEFTGKRGDIVGTLAARGNGAVSSFSIDSGGDMAVDGAMLVAGGDLTFDGGSIFGNHVADYRGTLDESRVAPGTLAQTSST
jgi:choice-of-anchor A domain-containing protein